jgi:hypothetical protein
MMDDDDADSRQIDGRRRHQLQFSMAWRPGIFTSVLLHKTDRLARGSAVVKTPAKRAQNGIGLAGKH